MVALARIHRLAHFIASTEMGSFTIMLVATLMMCVWRGVSLKSAGNSFSKVILNVTCQPLYESAM